jgi:carbonic anhydrase
VSNRQGTPLAGAVIDQATGFASRSPGEPGAAGIQSALARNRAFAAAGGHQDAVVFPNLRLFVITCLDPRVDPAHFLGLELSDAMVVRNGGGRVTPEVINEVAFIGQIAESFMPDGPLFEVAVIHHTQCGAGALADDAFRRRYAERIGADELTLRDRAVIDPVATVASDVERLRSADAISARVGVSGHVYDVATGLLETIVPAGGRVARTPTQPDPRRG